MPDCLVLYSMPSLSLNVVIKIKSYAMKQKCICQSPILKVAPHKKICNVYHRYTSTMRHRLKMESRKSNYDFYRTDLYNGEIISNTKQTRILFLTDLTPFLRRSSILHWLTVFTEPVKTGYYRHLSTTFSQTATYPTRPRTKCRLNPYALSTTSSETLIEPSTFRGRGTKRTES